MDPRRRMMAVVVLSCCLVAVAGDFAKDRDECSDQLVGLATCLTYVQEQATAAAPTPDCCSGLKTVLGKSRKCLCVLVKDKDDPSLGLKINVTRALGLPAICNAPANISDCPSRLLNLPPNSKDAQVFEQYAKEMGGQGTPSAATGGSSSAGAQKSGAATKTMTRWLGVGGARAAVLSIFFPLAMPFLLLLG
ncbi:hypothetical protein EJB05_14850 [Eragrostis curvula]|uniref:Bifunctional inhibitor/plant lipid transfer protein/seed storage helical domain-containing protein n=1 Tax=Eragrostis curvula TaxID=38414 RepID=A0A5J9W0B8_9POAL|nr:hypothetical protein EJB05_14850 [Eragrostis curvula]